MIPERCFNLIYLPNKSERYAAALRNRVQRLILNNGYTEKYREMLMKIYSFEAVNSASLTEPCDIFIFINYLLHYISLKKIELNCKFSYSVKTSGNYLINQKALTALILTVCKYSDIIEIKNIDGNIIVKGNCENRKIFKISKGMGFPFFRDVSSNDFYIIMSLEKTEKQPEKTKKEWDIYDPFSPINIFIC